MKPFNWVARMLGKPLPGWLTLLLICGTVAVASVPVYYGSVSVPATGTISDVNAAASTCVATNASNVYTYGLNCVKSVGVSGNNLSVTAGPTPNVSMTDGPTFKKGTFDNTGAGTTTFLTAQNTSPGVPVFLTLSTVGAQYGAIMDISTNTGASPPPTGIGLIRFSDPALTHPIVADIKGGFSGSSMGYMLLESTATDGSGTILESFQVTPGGHVGWPFDVKYDTVISPGTCTALATCATYTWTFTWPFVNQVGSPEAPICEAPAFQDITDSTIIWVGGIKTVSSTQAVFNFTPLQNTAIAHNLTGTFTCHEAGF